MKRTKMVCTIGPAASSVQVLKQMLVQGMDVARFNMSHGTHQSHLELINNARQASQEVGLPLAILVDTKGPEIRVGDFIGGGVELTKGKTFVLTTQKVLGNESVAHVNYAHLPAEVKKGTCILLNDGKIELSVVGVKGTDITTKVVVGGYLSNKKAVNLPHVDIQMPYISEQDKLDIKFACDVDADYLAISFVSKASDVLAIRKLLAKYGKPDLKIISKIECEKGVENAHEILEVSDGIMVARGDLGVEVDFAQIPLIQKQLIAESNEHGKISITATQMMESMSINNRPTRAEISDVANAICDGTTAVMLSAETSAGKHPALCVQTMAKIAEQMDLASEGNDFAYIKPENMSMPGNIGYGVCALEYALGDSAVVCINDFAVAKAISNFRPNTKIYSFTTNVKEYNQATLLYGVIPILAENGLNAEYCINYLISRKKVKKNTSIILVGNNTIKVVKI